MKVLLVVILLVSMVLAGCSNVRTYTFKKDRVDQRIEGNRGYIVGTPPPAPVEKEVPKRTMIGIDIEVPLLPLEKAKLEKGRKETVYEEEVAPTEWETPAPPVKEGMQETTSAEPLVTEKPVPSVEEKEEWIK